MSQPNGNAAGISLSELAETIKAQGAVLGALVNQTQNQGSAPAPAPKGSSKGKTSNNNPKTTIQGTQAAVPPPAAPPENETLEQMVERLKLENAALRAAKSKSSSMTLKVSDKGALSLYGLGKFPFTAYVEQWERILDAADDIRAFMAANAASLKRKGQ